ncbi:ribonuclease G [Natronospira proteinivora]|uniref:Ribonuclease G n=1 Tax=Natronospira proteinivora TaxID=1807133 RepID=A0ABT1G9G8_9GAMM|nr:ribonuclease G [Natronospira proteinivora]MCP1727692.1 ribonuclease G [Natronospira proteinivora]
MSEEILVNVTPRETRVALLENGVLQEVMIERSNSRGLVGNLYKGRVSRVLPGMQAAFIDIGLDRTAFLHASDIARSAHTESETPSASPANIRDLVQEGREILVQVLKDPLGTKGARLTTHISIPSRYLVYLPGGTGVGLSTRIENELERARLQGALSQFMESESPGGYIVRTAGEDASVDALRADMLFLSRLWESISVSSAQAKPGDLIHEDLPLPVRILRDMMSQGVEQVRVDFEATFQRMKDFAEHFIPELSPRVQHYTGRRPIFDLYGVDDEINRALERRVNLKSGGYLIIDQTEAMTTVDVNTGGFVGSRNLEETALKTNLEAARAIARQLRLRNLGGIIIIDFIDMDDEEHKRLVLTALERALAQDPAKNQVCEVSALGLVEMTRKRTRESLEHVLCEACPTCEGRGSLKTAETVCFDVFREILREAGQYEVQELLVIASQPVVDVLLDEESASLAEVEEMVGKPIRLQVETQYSQEQFDVVPT